MQLQIRKTELQQLIPFRPQYRPQTVSLHFLVLEMYANLLTASTAAQHRLVIISFPYRPTLIVNLLPGSLGIDCVLVERECE